MLRKAIVSGRRYLQVMLRKAIVSGRCYLQVMLRKAIVSGRRYLQVMLRKAMASGGFPKPFVGRHLYHPPSVFKVLDISRLPSVCTETERPPLSSLPPESSTAFHRESTRRSQSYVMFFDAASAWHVSLARDPAITVVLWGADMMYTWPTTHMGGGWHDVHMAYNTHGGGADMMYTWPTTHMWGGGGGWHDVHMAYNTHGGEGGLTWCTYGLQHT